MINKKIRSIMCIVIGCIMLLSGTTMVYANDYQDYDNNFISEEQFNELKQKGVYGEEVTYTDFINSLMTCEQEYGVEKSRKRRSVNYGYNYTPKKGDIVTTGASNTAKNGIVGHAGIFIDNKTILHIAGSKTSYTSTMSWSTWKNIYKTNNRVYRVSNSNIASRAADWVKRNYYNKKPGYQITSNWRSTSPTYCSKIVWQGYYFGTGSAPVMKKPVEPFYIQPKAMAIYFNSPYTPGLVFAN